MRFAIAYQTDGRTRLGALVRPVDTLELMDIADNLSGPRGVDAVDFRAATGSLVIKHELARVGIEIAGSVDGIDGYTDCLAPVRATIGRVDGLMTRLTTGGVDMRTITFVLMLGLALRQTMRGQIMVPAFSFLWYASEILTKSRLGDGDPGDSPAD
mgnify:CR=1 FL=1